MRFLSNFRFKIISMCPVNFWQQQDYNSLFKGSIGHVTLSAIIIAISSYPCGKLGTIKWRVQELEVDIIAFD